MNKNMHDKNKKMNVCNDILNLLSDRENIKQLTHEQKLSVCDKIYETHYYNIMRIFEYM